MASNTHEQAPGAEQVPVVVYARREDDHWSALVPSFTVAGRGDSPQAAIDNAVELLLEYLELCQQEGLTLAEARRPAPRRLQIRLAAQILLSRLRHRGADVQRRRVAAPGRLAHC